MQRARSKSLILGSASLQDMVICSYNQAEGRAGGSSNCWLCWLWQHIEDSTKREAAITGDSSRGRQLLRSVMPKECDGYDGSA